MSKYSKSIKVNLILIAVGFVLTVFLLANQPNVTQNLTEDTVIQKVEIPAEIAGRKEQIIFHTGYTVSYNSDWKIPNWVAYELTK